MPRRYQRPHMGGKPVPKYRNKKTVVDGITFDSQKEAQRYGQLKLAKREGKVLTFARQVSFPLPGNTRYRLDFLVMWSDWSLTFEDVKGHRTQTYKIKKKLFEEAYAPWIITEI